MGFNKPQRDLCLCQLIIHSFAPWVEWVGPFKNAVAIYKQYALLGITGSDTAAHATAISEIAGDMRYNLLSQIN